MNSNPFKKKTKLEKLNEKYLDETVEYKKMQLLSKIKKLQKMENNIFWDSSLKGTYRKVGEKNV